MDTLARCKCGQPMPNRVTCDHCDVPQQRDHNVDACVRCVTLNKWLPKPGEFEDMPYGYQNNAPKNEEWG